MGALHQGHLSLIRLAAAENTDVAVSIYINPTQFAPHEDLASYPRTWNTDIHLLRELDAELSESKSNGRITAIFAPTTQVMYPTLPPTSDPSPTAPGSFIYMYPLASLLEGASRPIFFRGVATVCMKLFNIVQPERVYFGQKDVQQTVVIKRMVTDFHLPIDVRVGPTMREEDGLAMSSRNVYLGARRRNAALVLSKALRKAESEFQEHGRTKRGDVLGPALQLVDDVVSEQQALSPGKRARVELDYLSLADPDSLEEIKLIDPSRGAILSGAVRMLPVEEPGEGEDCGLGGGTGVVRLIDNIILKPKP
jgi:pantoate--beta-alanine ligase